MVIIITSLKLRSFWKLPSAIKYSSASIKQIQQSGCKGYQTKVSLTILYTITMWNSPEEAKAYATSGAHLTAMKQARRLASEVRTLYTEGKELPPWKQAINQLNKEGKLMSLKA